MLVREKASSQRVNQSMHVSIALGWWEEPHEKRVEKDESGVTVCLCTFDRWHCTQVRAHLHTSALTLGQTYRGD